MLELELRHATLAVSADADGKETTVLSIAGRTHRLAPGQRLELSWEERSASRCA